MSSVAPVACRCGGVRGKVTNASRATVNRVVCYCDDCQTFAHHLGRADVLDAHGGSDIVQVAPATLSFEAGTEHIACTRLSPKGLYRFHSTCCRTPLGNAVGPAIPFVGIVASAFERPDDHFGPPIGAIQGKYAIGTPPPGSTGLGLGLIARAIRMVLGWKLGGRTWPHPYFERGAKEPRYPITVISKDERERARALAGPKP